MSAARRFSVGERLAPRGTTHASTTDWSMVHSPKTLITFAVALLVGAGCSAGASSDAPAPSNVGAAGAEKEADSGTIKAVAITDLAYFSTDRGPRIMVRGVRPKSVGFSLRVNLLDSRGQPAVIDPDGDGAPESSELEVDQTANDSETFFHVIESARALERFVHGVTVTPYDASGRPGERHLAVLAERPIRADGEACDAQGFDVCGADSVCMPGASSGSNHCQNATAARSARCADAPIVDLSNGPTSITGGALGASLWDPPESCANAERRARPDAAILLRVPKRMASVTLSTDAPTTTFDTVVYVLPGCSKDSTEALACNDDDVPPTSKVVLRDVAPGDYLVVVDALTREGGAFTLKVAGQ